LANRRKRFGTPCCLLLIAKDTRCWFLQRLPHSY